MKTSRIEALTEGIFAFAMTLLVMNLNLPLYGSYTSGKLINELLFSQRDILLNYVLSFILLAVCWMSHHSQFHYIKRTDRVHIWINAFFLMFVALIPFSTLLVGNYSKEWAADVVFGANLFIVWTLLYVNWAYATNNRRLVDKDIDPKIVALIKRRGLVVPIVSVAAMILSSFYQDLGNYCYFALPLILSLPQFKG